MSNYEKLGLFYLGRTLAADGTDAGGEFLYEAKDLTTHGVIVGMTGSGKTGLGITLIEEAAIDGIPVIAIDPKGDLGNLLLTFPQLRPEDFRPWVEPSVASIAGQTPDQYAQSIAQTWRKGLEESSQPLERIAKFADSADRVVYTPGSSSGLPLTILRSFAAPPQELIADGEAFRDRVSSSTSGLLSLVGVTGDSLTSPAHVLVATIFDDAWRAGRDLDLPTLIRSVQSPPFTKVGVFDLDSYFPVKDRTELAMKLNNLLASPHFAGWLEGEPLDVARLLHTPEGRPRISILSIAHLSEAERMFFVTLLLGEVLAWVRKQPGTSTLRAILYMDEVAGYFPPVSEPPSKRPMLTLLKQARAYGLGIVLATQNPVDLDYKGLSNTGTWFLGRLQTERDKARVLEGLEGASAASGAAFDRGKIEATLARLAGRHFLVNNVHEDAPLVIKTRFALSYLRGPLTRDQIAVLMKDRKAALPSPAATTAGTVAASAVQTTKTHARPILPPETNEYVLPVADGRPAGDSLVYRPAVLGRAKLHFVKSGSAGLDEWRERAFLMPVHDGSEAWSEDHPVDPALPQPADADNPPGPFAEAASSLLNAKSYDGWTKSLKDFVYRTQSASVWKCADLKCVSNPGESEGDFRIRIAQESREARDLAVEKLRKKYATKFDRVEKKIATVEARIEREEGQASRAGYESILSIGSGIFGVLFGRKKFSVTNLGRAATAARSLGRAKEQRGDVTRASESLEDLKAELDELNAELETEADKIAAAYDPQTIELEETRVTPRKSDTQIAPAAVVWCPYTTDASGFATPGWKTESA
ncbi:MAG: DUF87 domain-containing protein [Planctomycetaceae bacterium]